MRITGSRIEWPDYGRGRLPFGGKLPRDDVIRGNGREVIVIWHNLKLGNSFFCQNRWDEVGPLIVFHRSMDERDETVKVHFFLEKTLFTNYLYSRTFGWLVK